MRHFSPTGSYYAALIFYATLYGESPVGATHKLEGFEVDATTAEKLQHLAEEFIPSPHP